MTEALFAGFSRVNMNPAEPIPLGGYGNEEQRFHETVTQDICVSTVALTDSSNSTVLIISIDLVNADTPLCQRIRDAICAKTAVAEDRIFITVVHSHAAPSVRRMDMPCIQRYNEQVVQWCCQSAKQALTDRKPASLYAGSIDTQYLNFVKHYRARDNKTGAISIIGDLFGDTEGKTLLDHATQADSKMHLVRISRPEDKDIILVNFRAHPHFDGGSKKHALSSDYIGAFRVAFEAITNHHTVYIQGACGNINATSRLSGEQIYTTAQSYGLALAASAAEGLMHHMVPIETGPILTKRFKYCAKINKTSTELLEIAHRVQRLWKETFDYQKCRELSLPYGIRSPYHAGAIIANNQRDQQDGVLVLNAVSIGRDLAFTTFPGEMFDTLSTRIEQNSPFKTTLLLGYCNHNMSYLPSAAAYRYSCYETDITRFAPGTGEEAADTCIAALKELSKK